MSSRPPSKVVFVGNIPYGLSEEQIVDIFNSAGKVVSFRLVYDRETGRPKGFGFAEYPDTDSSASAVRNLNDYEIMGRKLRVDYSAEGRVEEDGDSYGAGANGTSSATAALPPLPPGKELPPGVSATDAISRTLNTLPPAQLLDILQQMKTFAGTDPARATALLSEAPQLSFAIFQALLLMGLVSPDAIHSVLDPNAAATAAAAAPQNQNNYSAPPVAPAGFPSASTGTPPVANPYAAPPPAANVPAAGADQEALIQQVMSLPQEMIDQLPPAERQQIMALRSSLGGHQR